MFDVDWVVPIRICVAFRLSRLFRPIRCEVCIRERKVKKRKRKLRGRNGSKHEHPDKGRRTKREAEKHYDP